MEREFFVDKLLKQDGFHYLLFGGKGGVGKTSCATAIAIWLADNGKKVLLVSTDPAHSISDSLDQTLAQGEITAVIGVDNLWALEIDPHIENEQFSRFMSQADLFGVQGMQEIITPFFSEMENVTPPGMDETMAFAKIFEFLKDTDYDIIVFDTAPTGHTLRFLGIPEVLSSWAGKMLKMKLRLGKLLSGFKALFGGSKDNIEAEALDELQNFKENIELIKEELSDPQSTEFIIVTIPELMAIYETERLLGTLIEYNIPVHNIIINQITPENPSCPFCMNRRSMQLEHLKQIETLYGDEYNLIEIPLFEEEVRRVDKLRVLAQLIVEGKDRKK